MSVDRVLVVIGRTRHKMVAAELQEAVKRGAKFIELRLDFLAKAVDFKRLAPLKRCPWVATLRRPADGGRFTGSEQERLMVLRQAIVSGAFDWVDLETDVANAVPRFGPVKRIVSYHNTAETPANLDDIYAQMLKQDADVYKVAVAAQSADDAARLVRLQRDAPKPTVAFCLGDIGQPTRFLALKFGAPWIYAAFNRERGIAPGLPSFDDLRTTYPVRSIGPDTKVFGVLGDPVGHSLSPLVHNSAYQKLGADAVYLPFRVPRGQLPQAVAAYESIPVHGYSVTIPHKEAAAAVAREGEPNVQVTASANTLVRRDDGRFVAANTDYAAAADSLKAHLAERAKDGPSVQLNQLAVLILGAGGAARSIAFALHREGAQITITARTHDRAQKLAEDVKCRVVDWHARHSVSFDVLVNCTPVGMHPNVDEAPCHFSILKPGTVVFDTVYTPETTLLIREARARGCDTITGVDMFVRQAARQVELFTGLTPDLDAMRQLTRKALSPLTKAFQDDEGGDVPYPQPPAGGAGDPAADRAGD
jgi:3-dehydroquinate dehydratase/shikimate dehydrogenase